MTRRSRRLPTAAAATLLAAAAALALLAGCQGGKSRTEHISGEGPLQSHTAAGVTSVYAPKSVPWAVTFGSFVLCTTNGEPITLDGVRYRAPVAPEKVSAQLRTVTPALQRETVDAGQIGAALGRPHHFLNRKAPGRYEAFRPGRRITQNCAEQDREGTGFTELVFVLDIGAQGGLVDRAWIDYHAGGTAYTLRLEWKMVACGGRVPRTVDGTEVCGGRQGV
ncbi:hypothetical protein [Streptomyces alanosinicus]|uniref:Lipoprotein n=1 Tax=Streptomyces alanosinicus TaxID=68171 RepID=A0A918YQW0_9ACTN|nr:hypothetical protein [Streptomyces alanosinicus]GHE12639.1 hypothetical protein GCM10010339_76670 [Streptomyces alanosinicus]